MSDTFITIFIILTTSVLIFMVPVVTMAKRNDVAATQAVQAAVTEFVDTARATGVITQEDYDILKQKLEATGNVYDVQVSIQYIDENPAKKTSSNLLDALKIGENVYYIKYTVQVDDTFEKNDGKIKLSSGDYLKVDVENENQTLYQNFKRFLYSLSSGKLGTISGTHVGIIIDTARGEQIGENVNTSTYTVTYNAGEGTGAPRSQTKYHGQDLTLDKKTPTPRDPDKQKFSHWQAQDGNTYFPEEIYSKDENLQLTAVYKDITLSVTYYSEIVAEGLPTTDRDIAKGSTYTIWDGRDKPTSDGYIFRGWRDQNGEEYYYIMPGITHKIDNMTEDMTFYAIWQGKTINITFNVNPPPNCYVLGRYNQRVTYGDTYVVPSFTTLFPSLEINDWQFLGWSTTEDGNVEYRAGQETVFASYQSEITLYAIWAEKYTLEYDANVKVLVVGYKNQTWVDSATEFLNNSVEGLTVDGMLISNNEIDRVVEKRYDYDCIIINASAWAISSIESGGVNKVLEIAKATNLITFGNDETRIPLIKASIHYTSDADGNRVGLELTPTVKGRELVGVNFGGQYDGSLYGIKFNTDYVTILYNGTYYTGEGVVSAHAIGVGQYVEGKNWVHGQIASIPNAGLAKLVNVAINGTEKTSSVVENMPEDEPRGEGEVFNLSSNIPTRNDAIFMGWSDTPNGEVKYEAGAQFTMPSQDRTLYAVWGSKLEYQANTKVLVVEYNKSNPNTWLNPTVNYFNSTGQFIADGMSINGGELENVEAKKDNYDLIIINASAWAPSTISTNGKRILESIANSTHLITLGNDERRIQMIKSSSIINQTEVSVYATTKGKELIGEDIANQKDSALYSTIFSDDVTVLYNAQYYDNSGSGEWIQAGNIIGFCKWSNNTNWIHGQVNTITPRVLYKLSKVAINGLVKTQSPVGNMPQEGIYRHGSTFKLSENIPTRNGSTFKGWAETLNGRVVYRPGDSFTMPRGNKKLYAVWE